MKVCTSIIDGLKQIYFQKVRGAAGPWPRTEWRPQGPVHWCAKGTHPGASACALPWNPNAQSGLCAVPFYPFV